MKVSENSFEILLKAILPPELFHYFLLVDVQVNDTTIDVYLDEENRAPDEYAQEKLISKGFYEPILVQDFPIRERAVYLHIKRRRWQVVSTREIVCRNWETVAKGTRYTQGFANFLKELFRQLPIE